MSDERDLLPVARVVRDDLPADLGRRIQPGDCADDNPTMIAGHLRTLQREMRDGFDSIGRALGALVRIEERLVVLIDRQNVLERRVDENEKRTAAQVADLTARVAKLEDSAALPVGAPAPGTVTRRAKAARRR